MPRPDLARVPAWFHNYINQVEEDDLLIAITNQTQHFIDFLASIPEQKRDFAYAPGKWTIKELLQHLVDAERIFAYRALCIARNDDTPLPGFDENSYVDHAKTGQRKWEHIVDEFRWLRKSNEMLFRDFDDAQLQAAGIASGKPVYVLAIGFIMVGHIRHHEKIIRDRYLS